MVGPIGERSISFLVLEFQEFGEEFGPGAWVASGGTEIIDEVGVRHDQDWRIRFQCLLGWTTRQIFLFKEAELRAGRLSFWFVLFEGANKETLSRRFGDANLAVKAGNTSAVKASS